MTTISIICSKCKFEERYVERNTYFCSFCGQFSTASSCELGLWGHKFSSGNCKQCTSKKLNPLASSISLIEIFLLACAFAVLFCYSSIRRVIDIGYISLMGSLLLSFNVSLILRVLLFTRWRNSLLLKTPCPNCKYIGGIKIQSGGKL